MWVPVRHGGGGGWVLVGGASPRGDRASGGVVTQTRLIASVLQAASAILVRVALAACPPAVS